MWSKVLLAAGMLVPAFAQNCTYSISPTSNPNVPAGGGSFSASITAVGTNCVRTAVSNVPWIQVTFGQSGSGSGSFGYGVQPNSGAARNGTITVAGLTFTITQAGCTFVFSPASASYPFGGGGPASFTVQPTPSSCTWTGTTTSDWINISNASGGPGSGVLSYSVAANPTPFARAGNIAAGNQTFSITEGPAPCVTTLAPAITNIAAGGGAGTFRVTVAPTGCTWTATSGSAFVTINSGASGANSGSVGYSVAANTGGQRSTAIRVNDQSFNITQDACAYTAVADQSAFSASGGSGVVAIATSSACPWTAASNSDFITISGATSGAGPARVAFTVAANIGLARSGAMTVAGQTMPLSQDSAPPPVLESVKNSASFAAGPVSPGEIVTLSGSLLGPAEIVNMQTTDDGTGATTLLAGTRVLFDGVAAPMIFTLGTQVSAVAPYTLDGKTNTQVQVEYQGMLSNAMTLDVVAATPGVYSLDSSGAGQALVLNEDFSFNGKDSPAKIGSVIQIYATGGGQTTPQGVDGKLVVDTPQPQLNLPVSVRIGGIDASVQFAGGASGMLAGRVQISVVIPDGVDAGDAVPVVVQVGDVSSQDGVTIAVAPAQ